jgi:cytochrome c-type biogenesis protein CcmE
MAGIFASILRCLRKPTNPPIKLFLVVPLLLITSPAASVSASMLEIAELLTHPEQYDRQEVVVSGQVTNVQLATNRQGQPAYGFLLKDQAGTLKVISLGQVEVREGDQVIVEGVFSRLRQAGRTIIYNEIKALSIKPMNRLNPDLVG